MWMLWGPQAGNWVQASLGALGHGVSRTQGARVGNTEFLDGDEDFTLEQELFHVIHLCSP